MLSQWASTAGNADAGGKFVRILIVDDCRLRREYLAQEMVGRGLAVTEAWDLESFQTAMQRAPRVLVINMQSQDSRPVLQQSVDAGLASHVVVFGLNRDDEDEIVSLAASGVYGYHLRADSLVELLTFIDRVAVGYPGCSPGVSSVLLRRLSLLAAERQDRPDIALLTGREREVLELMELGLSNLEIAGRLNIAAHTVKKHVHNVLKKLGAVSRSEAAAIGRSALPLRPQ